MEDREKQVDELFAQAVQLEPAERQKLFSADGQDGARVETAVVAEVLALLAEYSRAEAAEFLQAPLVSAALAEPTPTLVAGQEVEGYKILRFIAEGGMGEVYLAEETALKREVALKLIRSNLKSKEVLRRFINERQILANLEHPNIARLLSAGATRDGQPFFVMEYVAGRPLDQYASERDLSLTLRLRLFRTICAAVTYAHQHLIIHRDIKPSNILVTADGTPKLLDFGIAKLLDPAQTAEPPLVTATMVRAMTPEYASPEQVRGEPVTTATDIYSLGVLLYELLVGQRPYRFKSSSPDEVARVICTVEPERPSQAIADDGLRIADLEKRSASNLQSAIRNPKSLRGDIDNIILKALRKEPARRYASVSDFAEDIRRHLEGLPVTARKDTFTYRASKFVRRNKIGVTAAALILLTLIAGIVATAWEARVARAERARAEQRFNDVRRMANSFMFELNDEIQKGPTKAREMLVKKALEYLDSLAQEARDDPSLRRELATAYERVGDIQGQPFNANLGNTAGALASYGKAQAMLEELAASEPKNLEVSESLCHVYEKTGWVQLRTGDSDAALESGRKEIAKAELLAASQPSNADYQRLLSRGYLVVGEATSGGEWSTSAEDYRRVLESFRKAFAITEKLSAADPTNIENRLADARSTEYVGYALWHMGDLTGDVQNYREAFEYFRRKREIGEFLFATDQNRFRRHFADAINDFGSAQMKLGDTSGALETFRQALSRFEQIAASDPKNVETQRDLAGIHLTVAEDYLKAGDFNSALSHSRQALALYETLQNLDSNSAENQYYLMQGYNQLGEVLEKMKNWSEAQGNRFTALAALEALSKGEAKTRLSKDQIRRLIALEDMTIAKDFEEIAAAAPTPATKRPESWRQAREWYQHSLEHWQEIQAQGKLSITDASKPDEVLHEIARCDQALNR